MKTIIVLWVAILIVAHATAVKVQKNTIGHNYQDCARASLGTAGGETVTDIHPNR